MVGNFLGWSSRFAPPSVGLSTPDFLAVVLLVLCSFFTSTSICFAFDHPSGGSEPELLAGMESCTESFPGFALIARRLTRQLDFVQRDVVASVCACLFVAQF